MPKTIKITDEHFAKLHKIARAMGPGATPAHAFQSALDAEHAKHYGASGSGGDDDGDEEPAPGEIGADDEDSILPGMKTLTDDPGEKRAKQSLAARQANFTTAMNAVSAEPGNPKKAVAAAAESVEAASDDLPPARKGGKANPLSTLRRWASSPSVAGATQPRAQRRG